ncbi:unnamed protein product [Miscanthus lutarioriparius]|uniref:Uncharacterized protein n=1 Tax=Miscanthus lutarioriparius TaxID=422564 RepID=A0A811PE08_9POAL|nr:unnamed protein product [Miscanthus lutarioriparius]
MPDPALGAHGEYISKLKRGRSRVTPRSTCQTLTSSSKVEAASMSGKCEIRFDADPIQGASGGLGQVTQVSNFEKMTHTGSSSPPPLDLLNCPDEFKSLERDRLLPCDLKTTSPSALQQYDAYLHWFYYSYRAPAPVAPYDAYLHWFYYSHRAPAPVASLADAASMCLDKENSMTSLWVSVNACCNWHGCTASKFIVGYMHIAIKEKGEIEHPFGIDAAKCIAKEAELISEWLRRGRRIFTNDEYTALCHDIRVVAAQLFISRWKWSVHIAAVLLGIRKEAEWLIENSKCNSDESINTSMKIRQFTLRFVRKKHGELEPYKNESSESEMTSEQR